MKPAFLVAIPLFSILSACGFVESESEVQRKIVVSAEERQSLIASSHVLKKDALDKVAERDLVAGPKHKFFTKPVQDVECAFVEPSADDLPGGRTPKFKCSFSIDGKTKDLKVKYDPYFNDLDMGGVPLKKGKHNFEVYGEVLATRLMWALGFQADDIYTVRVTCRNCPPDPWLYVRKKAGVLDQKDGQIGFVRTELLKDDSWQRKSDRVFEPAVVEVKNDGDAIITDTREGWDWAEMYDAMTSPATQRPERDALTLLMALINHMDNKAEQQRLICGKDDLLNGKCMKSFLMVQDAGSNFGNGWAPLQGDIRLSKLDIEKWKKLSTWEGDPKDCKARVQGAPNASFRTSWSITEAGRALLASHLAKLSRKQIDDLFTASRIGEIGLGVTATDWADAFEMKVQRDIFSTRCTN